MVYVSANQKAVSLNLHRYNVGGEAEEIVRGDVARRERVYGG